ncbi:hypothetical protein SAMN02745824_2768 [Parasphingorhabdus marina DSM 22363]|uniref:Uncharacterized protein n=1 Tax=Parasphingorhabdus marina DSM 22363 TaxID=1123272 RepID=A0A1N6GCJ2_9SPHN|nr:hypothetical protein SAMN02745824_2768 [Parasphingorhabdus marina DSM 22363]
MFSVLLALAMAGGTAATPAETDIVDEKKIVCRTHRVVGSRIPERVCRTNKEWARIDKENDQQLRKRFDESRGTQNSN